MARNVLMISVDDMIDVVRHRDAFGVEIRTPAIDELMARGVTFDNAFTPSPICNPARVATMTGRSPFWSGVHHNEDKQIYEVVPVHRTLVGSAHDAGWHTATRGKVFHHQTSSQKVQDYLAPALDDVDWTLGYRSAGNRLPSPSGGAPVPEREMQDAMTAAWTARFLDDPPKDKPFFLAVGTSKPHLSWDVPKKYYDMYDPAEIRTPQIDGLGWDDLPEFYKNVLGTQSRAADHVRILKADAWTEQIHAYLAAISFADAQIGKILDAMTKGRHWQDTTVVLWSDHGYHLGDRDLWKKFTLWEEAASVPLIFVDPEVGRPGTHVSTPASLLDIWPTLSGLAGLSPPRNGDGLDLSVLMEDPAAAFPRKGVVTAAYGSVSVRTEKWRYTLYNSGEEELFRVDEGQIHDRGVANLARRAWVVDRMQALLETEVESMGGQVALPGETARGTKDDDVFLMFDDATAVGRAGDDVYFVADDGRIFERRKGGEDEAIVAVNAQWQLPDNLENASLTHAVTGGLMGNRDGNILRGSRYDNVLAGGRGYDKVFGERGDDILNGGFGQDTLVGGRGDDFLHGGRNNDVLRGGAGNDKLVGARGADVLYGGDGRDLFDFHARLDSPGGGRVDTIADFSPGKDRIDLTDIDAVAGGRLNEAFTWRGRKAFSGEAGELRWGKREEEIKLRGDVDGDGEADFVVKILGASRLDDDDILL